MVFRVWCPLKPLRGGLGVSILGIIPVVRLVFVCSLLRLIVCSLCLLVDIPGLLMERLIVCSLCLLVDIPGSLMERLIVCSLCLLVDIPSLLMEIKRYKGFISANFYFPHPDSHSILNLRYPFNYPLVILHPRYPIYYSLVVLSTNT